MIIWGSRLYGKVDRVPGLFYVATVFFHLWFIPLIPTATYVVLEGSEDGEGWKGVTISLSGKSILAAYGRTFLLISAVVMAIASLVMFGENAVYGTLLGVGAIAAVGLMVLSYRGHATLARAKQLAAMVKLDPAVIETMYGPGVEARAPE
jgi:hypothetical protein